MNQYSGIIVHTEEWGLGDDIDPALRVDLNSTNTHVQNTRINAYLWLNIM